MDAYDCRDSGCAAEISDDCLRWFHILHCSDFRDTCNRRVAITATDLEKGRRYNRNMLERTKKKKKPPSKPINQWVLDALRHAKMSQAALGRALHDRKVIADDRSIVNKMTMERDVSADEVFAISEITGYPAPNEKQAIETVPLLGWVSAGDLAREDIADEALGSLLIANLEPGDWIALRVTGDSMDRISPPESIIVVNRRDRRLVANGCYVISDENGDATYKRYRPGPPMRFEPVSTNDRHEPIFPDQEPLIVGRVKRTMLDM